MKYALNIAKFGLEEACKKDAGLAAGVNIYDGKCVNKNVAKSLDIEFTELENII